MTGGRDLGKNAAGGKLSPASFHKTRFLQLVINSFNITETIFTLEGLKDKTQYFWHVQAKKCRRTQPYIFRDTNLHYRRQRGNSRLPGNSKKHHL